MSLGSRSITLVLVMALWLIPGAMTPGWQEEHAGPSSSAAVRVPLAAPDAAVSDLRLRVPAKLAIGDPVDQINHLGSISADVDVLRLDKGQLRVARNLWDGKGLRFPAYTGTSSPPRAVLRVRHDAKSGDPLAPGNRDFAFSIYFKKDAKSSGTKVDNGDNLMQRGAWTDPAQYKLQVDGGRPSCTVKGDRGRVTVKSTVTADHRQWFRAQCARTGDTLRLTVTAHRPDGSTRTVVTSRSGKMGSLAWPERATPLAIGGTLSRTGEILPNSSDQFNGWATHPRLAISP